MPQLGDVLGGVLAEVVRGRLAADTLTAELLAAYRGDPRLSMLSVPRVTVREMSVTLRFAVNEVQSVAPSPAEAEREAEEWQRILHERVLRRVIDERLRSLRPEERAEVQAHMAPQPAPVLGDRMRTAVAGEPDALMRESVGQLVTRFRAVPTRLRRRLGTIQDLRAEFDAQVHHEFETFIEHREQLAGARRAMRSRMEVEVVTDELQARPAQAIQELTLTLSMSDIENEFIEVAAPRSQGS